MGRFAYGVAVWLAVGGCGADTLVPWRNDNNGPSCRDVCAEEGQTLCESAALSTCQTGKEGCLEWSTPVPCPGARCLNSTQCDPCVHQCGELGPSCGPGGETVEICELDANGCRVLRSEICTETCIAGVCGQFALHQVASGGTFSCQLAATGAVQCWGENAVGDGSFDQANAPRDVKGLNRGVTSICAGETHACAVLDTGAVRCWGRQVTGELGDGRYDVDQPSPVTVVDLGGVAIDVDCAGGFTDAHTCALLDGGSIRCWGSDSQGMLGDGGFEQDQATPVSVVGLPGPARQVAVGEFNTCAVLESGAAYCWGMGLAGRLGTGSYADQSTPALVLASGVDSIAVGGWHSCVLMNDGKVECWGNDSHGSVGNGDPPSGAVTTPVEVDFGGIGGTVAAISAGDTHTCALMSDDRVLCWGGDDYFQLGDDNPRARGNQTAPVAAIWPSGLIDGISAARHHTCVLNATGRVGCWGWINGWPSSGPLCFACLDQ